jgi:hypothetical protein
VIALAAGASLSFFFLATLAVLADTIDKLKASWDSDVLGASPYK